MDSLSAIFAALRERNQPVPRPQRLPSTAEVDEMESQLGVTFPPDYRKYLLEVSDVVYGTMEPVTITRPHAHTHLASVLADARTMGVPQHLLPICGDNGDYYCVASDQRVIFWSHNGATDESWSDIGEWISEVWMDDA